MFTGIIKEIGKIINIGRLKWKTVLSVESGRMLKELEIGSSVSVNGVCLTVVSLKNNRFDVEVVPETMKLSNLSDLSNGDYVNLENSLKINDDLSGHIVLGHIDGAGKISDKRKEGDSNIITVEYPEELGKYIAKKGSISIDGISLTVVDIDDKAFKVAIIPHTLENSTLSKRKINDMVNLEVDVLARYLERLLLVKEGKGITIDKLKKLGF